MYNIYTIAYIHAKWIHNIARCVKRYSHTIFYSVSRFKFFVDIRPDVILNYSLPLSNTRGFSNFCFSTSNSIDAFLFIYRKNHSSFNRDIIHIYYIYGRYYFKTFQFIFYLLLL